MKTSHIFVLILVALLAGLVLQPMISAKAKKEIDPLDEAAVYLVNRLELEDSESYTLSYGEKVEVAVKRGSGQRHLEIKLESGVCLNSERWSNAFDSPSGDAKNLYDVKIDGDPLKENDFTPEEFKTLSDRYQAFIREIVKIKRDSVKAKVKDLLSDADDVNTDNANN